jgi:hypothetical protein
MLMKWQIIILGLLLISLVNAECIDSDNGKNKYDAGQVIDDTGTYYDGCQDNDIKEYFCSVEGLAAYAILPCLNGCKDNACQIANRIPKAAPEVDSYPNLKYYFYAIAAIIIIGLYIYYFKIKRKFKRRKYEEY